MKVMMIPHRDDYSKHESGIRRCIQAYFQYLPSYGVELVPKAASSFDLLAAHAGTTGKQADICHSHGLYWSSDYQCTAPEYNANRNVIEALRHAREVTVPTEWVAETIRRDMRIDPHIVPHGIEVEEWNVQEHGDYVLWNKNRNRDVCDPTPMVQLAEKVKGIRYLTTFLPVGYNKNLPNIKEIGLRPHAEMKKLVEQATVYLSTTKETFGIGVLEAMAAAVPVLGFAWGGNKELIEHGRNGYLARPNDIDDFARGLAYCIEHRDTLGKNGREMSKEYKWEVIAEQVAGIYRLAMKPHPYKGQVSVIVPVYNYANMLERAVVSALEQARPALEIIIVDDGSTDNTSEVATALAQKYQNVRYIAQRNSGVAVARNRGIEEARGEYICCIDADDKIAPKFLEACLPELEKDPSLGIAYTGIWGIKADGKEGLTTWPSDCNYDLQFTYRSKDNARGHNQVPTCCVVRKKAWERTGGYKSRYAPLGAGSEDADLWTRIMAIGYGVRQVTKAGLFIYSLGTGMVSGNKGQHSDELTEPRWLSMHPHAKDKKFPFACRTTPPEKRASHPVRQYDEPVVSIVIPVGEGHEKEVYNALDSVESQTYRLWEVVLAWDSPNEPELVAYPYVRLVKTGSKGPGYARNRGAEHARAPFLVFLDADDQFAPEFLEKCLFAFQDEGAIVYTDYVSSHVTTDEDLKKNFKAEEVLHYNTRTNIATISGRSADYDCERAQRQPEKKGADYAKPFHWCLVTCLVPKAWHMAIGGFDETMESFEDVLYHWVMARNYCYVRLPEQLISYKMHTGTRREKASKHTEQGRRIAVKMLQYSERVLKEVPVAKSCSGCGGRRTSRPNLNVINDNSATVEKMRSEDDNFLMCKYTHPNKGNQKVVGAATGTRYGHKGGGAEFLVHRSDVEAQPHFFTPIPATIQDVAIEIAEIVDMPGVPQLIEMDVQPIVQASAQESVTEPAQELAQEVAQEVAQPDVQPDVPKLKTIEEIMQRPVAPVETAQISDLRSLPGISPAIAEQLETIGITTQEGVLALGADGLQQLHGIGAIKAQRIIDALGFKFEVPPPNPLDRTNLS